MKRIATTSLLISLLLLFKLSAGQEPAIPQDLPQITAMEYFFDEDPGFGNGVNISLTPGEDVNESFDVDMSSLSPGFHILYVRVQDAVGNWSLAFTDMITKFPNDVPVATPLDLPLVTAMEYFFDEDPGFGNGVNISFTPVEDVNESFDADMSALSPGFHILNVRVQDAVGNWSLAFTDMITKFPNDVPVATPLVLHQTTAMEYFFDEDPGFGSGVDVPVTAGTQVNNAFDADLSALNSGFHILYFRVKDELENWSLAYTHLVIKFPDAVPTATPLVLHETTAMEYFFDMDPGFGLGESVPVTSGTQVNESFDADLSALTPGFHVLYVRAKDELDAWSLLYSRKIYTFPTPEPIAPQTLPDIVAMEYFFNNDPGFGNGTEIINTPGSSIAEDLIAGISALGKGNHVLYVRVKDENNMWSQSFIQRFCIKGLQVFLEGPYDTNTGLMSTALNDAGLLPHSQPFDSDPAAVWYYDGNETVTEIPNANVVDWLLLQARDADSPENATSEAVNETQVAFLLNDGEIVGLDGESLITFSEPIINDLYLVVFQRNHVGVMSAFPLDLAGECEYTYSFDASAARAHGDENGHKQISPGVWGMAGGDGDADGQITLNDKVIVWQVVTGSDGYLQSDFTMDGQTDNKDKDDQWVPNVGAGSFIPD